MMLLKKILTQRSFQPNLSMQIVYEWEDVLASIFHVPVCSDFHSNCLLFRVLRRLFPFVARLTKPTEGAFVFEMFASRDVGNNKSNIVPCVIDFFLRDDSSIRRFYKDYSKNPIVLVSSCEAYEFLRSQKCPLPICHWALSVPDSSIKPINESAKQFDVAVMGRENPVLSSFLDRYLTSHPTTTVIRRVRTDRGWCYRSNVDDLVYPADTREQYLDVMRMARVGLYATPGMDGAKDTANGYNQVTPRFLEFIASGCRVVARYTDNPDTRYFDVTSFAPNIKTYEQFERAMLYAIAIPIPEEKRLSYLKRHATSTRARELQEILAHAKC